MNRAKNTTILEEPLTPSDRWHHPNGVLPTVFGLAMAPVFLSTGEHLLNFSIDGHHAAEMPFDVEAVDAPSTSQAIPALEDLIGRLRHAGQIRFVQYLHSWSNQCREIGHESPHPYFYPFRVCSSCAYSEPFHSPV
ncbi:hypothetical protein CBI38_25705 [Rhodococcus oxybenzonivorans]|uniref:Uncharacterized protein n=1 Tax=Rhodococcus oxybenzonivorans TaxID=1990687 RepID=A0A2S2C0T5_9NOCA|nr:hypothetical protein CBI38_25705 [Rhodococcus oxybenzonivorans]